MSQVKQSNYSEKVSYHTVVGDKLNDVLKEFLSTTLRREPEILSKVEIALDQIVKDGKIDSSDVPTFMLLVLDLSYSFNTQNVDTYEVLKTITQTLFDIYVDEVAPHNEELKIIGEKLIDCSIVLLKTTVPIVKKSLFICCK